MPTFNDLSAINTKPSTSFPSEIGVDQQGVPCTILHGDWQSLPTIVKSWTKQQVEMCQPVALFIMDGSPFEDQGLKAELVKSGRLRPLPKYENCYLARTDPKDVARVESKTIIATRDRLETVPLTAEGVKGTLGNWISPDDLDARIQELFPGCMKGRVMYLIPFSMGPIGGPLSKNGVELTDSAYVAVSMRVMTRVGTQVLECIKRDNTFVKCLHSVGYPLKPGQVDVNWPCNPERVMVAHKPHSSEIISFGSSYGGNSLLGKKCFALRIGTALAKKEGWLAEHMLIMGLRRTDSKEPKYITAAFPSACGKTNMAMMQPALSEYTATCIGDDIAWLRFDKSGDLRAINPENGFFGVAPGTSMSSNPIAMSTIFKDTIFTNVAETDDGGVWWEGMTNKPPQHLIDWQGKDWTPGCNRKAAHPNSRFCAPAYNCPNLDEAWEDPNGVKIDAIIFGGRRPEGIPLVIEALNWQHGVLTGAALKSEATAAAEHKEKIIMHDPFSMRPFFGYNFGDYLNHWLSFGKESLKYNLPRMYLVNWFRKDAEGQFMWPGFGENVRVLDWILRRCRNDENIADITPIGYVPKPDALNLKGLDKPINIKDIFSVPKQFWLKEIADLRQYFKQQVGASLPPAIITELDNMEKRLLHEGSIDGQ